jgi:hypothetical protein
MTEHAGWGWWSVYAKMEEFHAEVSKYVPFPEAPERVLPVGVFTTEQLREMLQRFGGYLVYLYANQGHLKGRRNALKDIYGKAVAANKARSQLPKSASEAARETELLSDPEIGHLLRDTQRRLIEIEACIEHQDGLIRAYDIAWKTISRQLSGEIAEMELTTSRIP